MEETISSSSAEEVSFCAWRSAAHCCWQQEHAAERGQDVDNGIAEWLGEIGTKPSSVRRKL